MIFIDVFISELPNPINPDPIPCTDADIEYKTKSKSPTSVGRSSSSVAEVPQ